MTQAKRFNSASRNASALLAVVVLAVSGCWEETVHTYYGRQQLPMTTASVNGTDVLAGMFSEAGHRVSSRRVLISSEMKAVDTIVWFPDDYAAPKNEACEWLDDWLRMRKGRTVIYVGRDYDAGPRYWQMMAPLVSPEQRAEYGNRETQASFSSQFRRSLKNEHLSCDWFDIEKAESVGIGKLSGPWSDGIDATKADMDVHGCLVPPEWADELLATGDDVLVAEQTTPYDNGSKLITVANGSFLLNLPLVNHEHRKLAGKLIAAVGPPGKVLFLESTPGGPPIDPKFSEGSMWSVFGAWPLNAILLHLAVLGIIFCFARWPIFGRPKTPPAEAVSDFGKHVDALGELMRRTKDRQYAMSKLPQPEESISQTHGA